MSKAEIRMAELVDSEMARCPANWNDNVKHYQRRAATYWAAYYAVEDMLREMGVHHDE